jgi:hypothetical protein
LPLSIIEYLQHPESIICKTGSIFQPVGSVKPKSLFCVRKTIEIEYRLIAILSPTNPFLLKSYLHFTEKNDIVRFENQTKRRIKMATCECVSGCPFFNGKMACAMPAIVENMKKVYCLGSNANCARYMVSKKLGKTFVPADLIPNQEARAKDIMAKAPVTTA